VNYHNVGRFTTYGKNFKYTFLTSFFPHPSEDRYNINRPTVATLTLVQIRTE